MSTEPYRNQHPFGMTDQQVELARVNALEMRRADALGELRELGPVRKPFGWWESFEWLPQTNAFVSSRFIGAQLRDVGSGLGDALQAGRSLVRPVRSTGVGLVSIAHRQVAHDYAMTIRASSGPTLHDLLARAPAHGLGLAVVTSHSGHGRNQRTTYHLARAGHPIARVRIDSVDHAVELAQRELAAGRVRRPVAILRTASGIRAVELRRAHVDDALVTVIDGSSAKLSWRATNRSLVAVVGLDGVVFPSPSACG